MLYQGRTRLGLVIVIFHHNNKPKHDTVRTFIIQHRTDTALTPH
jgi:hypothetical protein